MGRGSVRFLVLIANCFLCFGACYLYDTIVSLQPFLISERCLENASISNCSSYGLGFNPLEYNILVGLPLAVSTVAGLVSGFVIDRYGYCLYNILSSLFVILGAVVRALGARQDNSHTTSYALLLLGGMLIDNAFTIIYIVELYVSARWFSGRYLSFVVGLTLAVSLSGSVVAYYVNPVLLNAIGLENTLWCAIPFGATTVVSAVLLAIGEKMAKGKNYGTVEQEQPSTMSLKTLRSLGGRFWVVSVIIAISWLLFYAFIGNSVAYQTDIYGIPYEAASFSSGIMYVTKIIFSPIAGAMAGYFDIHGPVGVIGCLCPIGGLTMLSFAVGPPIVIIILMGLGFAIVYTVMTTVLTELVSFDNLGTANGVMNSFLCLAIGFGDITVGAITENHSDRVQGWLKSALFLLAIAVIELLMMALLLLMDARSTERFLCWSTRKGYESLDAEMYETEKERPRN